MRKNTRAHDLTIAAATAALYAVLAYFGNVFSLTFGVVQVRFAEALTVLPFLFPSSAPGLAVGCLLANLASPYGVADVVAGTLATAIAAALTAKMPRWYLAPLPPIVVNLLILPPMWAWAQTGTIGSAFFAAWGFNLLVFLPGQFIACGVLGTLLLRTSRLRLKYS